MAVISEMLNLRVLGLTGFEYWQSFDVLDDLGLEILELASSEKLFNAMVYPECLHMLRSLTLNFRKVRMNQHEWAPDAEQIAEVAEILLGLPLLGTLKSSEELAEREMPVKAIRGVRGTPEANFAFEDLETTVEALVALHPERWLLQASVGGSRVYRRV